jgi:hypothetical protein
MGGFTYSFEAQTNKAVIFLKSESVTLVKFHVLSSIPKRIPPHLT